jgi:WD40 repeat protein
VVSETHVRVFDLPTGNLRAVLGHEEELQAIRFSPESKILATLSHGIANIWNYATGELLSRISAGYVRDVRFAREGRYIITGSNDRTAVAWLWKVEDLREEACKRLTRNLTRSEWSRYLGSESYRKTCPNLPADPGSPQRLPSS